MVKEVARHVLRRPVVGLVAYARTKDGRVVLVKRSDTQEWALPGGTLEWGETLRSTLVRELHEEAGVDVLEEGELLGVYSDPTRDMRFHAVTVVVAATVTEPLRAQVNPLEILEVRLFKEEELPATLSHRMTDILARARQGTRHWE